MPRNDSPEGCNVPEGANDKEKVPPAVFSRQPEKEIEERVRNNPDDPNAKVDLGSDESMDASDPPTAAQPGSNREPPPSSGFPDED